jgi:type IV secretory pathway VirB10-like protein
VTDAPQEEAAKPEINARPPREMRLRPRRAPVMRLSRRVLVGLGVVAAAGISVALFFALQPQRRTTSPELYNTDNRTTPDGLASLPRNYGELPRMPNGRSIVLERQPGTDPEGYAGLEDQVDNHWGMLFEAAILTTLLSIGSEAGANNNENALVQALRQGSSQGFSQVGEQVVGRSLNVQPTITVRPGFPVRVLVTHDLVLEPYPS